MQTTLQLLEAVKRRRGIASDYALAKHLGVSRQVMSSYRSGTTLGEDMAMKVADELGVPRAAVLAAMASERTKNEDVKKAWAQALKKLGAAAAALLGGGPTPPAPPAISHKQARNTQCSPFARAAQLALRRLATLIAPALIATGCTVIGHKPAPADWPRLAIVEHHLPVGAMYAQCYPYVPLLWKLAGAIVEGCAVANFPEGRCDIYVRGDFPDARVLEHERLHCAGRDHPASSALSTAWAEWRDAMAEGTQGFVYVRADGQTVIFRKP